MADWIELASQVLISQSEVCVFPAECPPEIQKQCEAHNQYVLGHLLIILKKQLDDDEKKIILRKFLAMRSRVIAGTSIDYPNNPFFPANQICLKIAKEIVNDDESICQVVMPHIKRIIGTAFEEEDLKNATEDDEKQLSLENFLLHSDGDALIHVRDLFNCGHANTNRLFAVITADSKKDTPSNLFNLSPHDLESVSHCAGDASKNYLNALKEWHCIRYDQKPCVGSALQELQIALFKSSKKKKGSELDADLKECSIPILQFYEIWTALPIITREKIKNYKVKGASLTLESNLLCLFAHTPGIVLSDADYRRVEQEKIVPCTHEFSSQFDTLLLENVDLYEMPLRDDQKNESGFDTKKLTPLFAAFEEALKNRQPLLGVNDRVFGLRAYVFMVLAQHYFDKKFLGEELAVIANNLGNVEQVVAVLAVLPHEYWAFWMDRASANLSEVSELNPGRSDVLAYYLKNIPVTQWKHFFSALSTSCFFDAISGYELGEILIEIPETQWTTLMTSCACLSIICDELEVAKLLCAISIDLWSQVIALCKDQITIALKDVRQFLLFLQVFPTPDVGMAINLLGETVSHHFSTFSALHTTLIKLSRSKRIMLLDVLREQLCQLNMTQEQLGQLLTALHEEHWLILFRMMERDQLHRLFPSVTALVEFLTDKVSPNFCVICIHSLSGFLPHLINSWELLVEIYSYSEISHESRRVLLRSLRENLPIIVTQALSNPKNHTLPLFQFLIKESLPLLFARQNLELYCPSLKVETVSFFGLFSLLKKRLHISDTHCMTNGVISLIGCFQKIQLLSEFLNNTCSNHTRLHTQLKKYFGESFFPQILAYMEKYLATQLIEESSNERQMHAITFPMRPGNRNQLV